jgi:hypothetical protein
MVGKKNDLQGKMPESWACVDCGINTAPGIMNRAEMENASALAMGTGVEQTFCDQSEVYTVFPWVWKASGLGDFDGCLCIGCLEKRIGRTLTPNDFPQDHPFNIMPGTDRLLSRRGSSEWMPPSGKPFWVSDDD